MKNQISPIDVAKMFGAQIVRGPVVEKGNVSEFQSALRLTLAREIRCWKRNQWCGPGKHWDKYNYTSLRGIAFQLKDCSYWGDLREGNWRTALYLLHRLHDNSYDPNYEPGLAANHAERLRALISKMSQP